MRANRAFGQGGALPAPANSSLQYARAEIIADRPRAMLKAGQGGTFDFRIKNAGTSEWPALGAFEVKLESRWRQAGRVQEPHAEKRLPFDVEPGDTVGLTLWVVAPAEPGEYLLEVDLRQEQGSRFSDEGSKAWQGKVEVVPKE